MQPATDGISQRIRGLAALCVVLLLTIAVGQFHDDTGPKVHAPAQAAQGNIGDGEVVDLRDCASPLCPDAVRGELDHHEFCTLTEGDENLVAGSLDFSATSSSDPDKSTDDAENVVETFAVARNGDLLLVPVTIGGHEYPFIVDTCSSWCVVDSTLRSHLVPTKKTVVVNDKEDFDVYEMPDAYIGESRLRVSGEAVCCDLAELGKSSGHEFRGFIGMSFLKAHVLHIDFDAGILAFLKHGPDSTEGAIDISYRSSVPMIDVKLPLNEEATPFKIDSGMRGGSRFDVDTFHKLIESGCLAVVDDYAVYRTVHGREIRRDGLIRQLSIGQFEHVVHECSEGRSNSLGLDVLSQYVVTIDFPNNRLHLQKGKRCGESPRFDMSGLALSRIAEKTVVKRVYKGSPSKAAGVLDGDQLLRVDGIMINELSLFDLKRRLTEEGRVVRLVVRRNGESRTIEIRLRDWQNVIPKLREVSGGDRFKATTPGPAASR